MNLVYPVLAQIAWTFVVLAIMFRARVQARQAGVKMSDIALSGEGWPPEARAAGNNFSNQFETPVLFYALCGVATYVAATNWLMTLFAWIFVASRIVHTFIHTGSNRVPVRAQIYAVGIVALFAMFVGILLKVL
ncbi:MAPEG family protein [Terrarubrum flagellatum]|uniref:MAPEG family protein n=1 Tax=Terrirubrum flagellatum TaxID=2895980 RepID=UPI003145282C